MFVGSNSKDNEDEKTYNERSPDDRTGRDSKEHVPAFQEDDQRTNRMVDRPQVHEEG